MFIYSEKSDKIQATKCYRRPRFRNGVFGRAWQWGQVVVDGQARPSVYEGSFGARWYFEFDSTWYWVRMLEGEYAYDIPRWNEAFSTTPP